MGDAICLRIQINTYAFSICKQLRLASSTTAHDGIPREKGSRSPNLTDASYVMSHARPYIIAVEHPCASRPHSPPTNRVRRTPTKLESRSKSREACTRDPNRSCGPVYQSRARARVFDSRVHVSSFSPRVFAIRTPVGVFSTQVNIRTRIDMGRSNINMCRLELAFFSLAEAIAIAIPTDPGASRLRSTTGWYRDTNVNPPAQVYRVPAAIRVRPSQVEPHSDS
jgi:hypothetical protein